MSLNIGSVRSPQGSRGERARVGRYSPSGRQKSDPADAKYPSAINGQKRRESVRRNSLPLFWVAVDAVTHRLSDGRTSRTPAALGQWGGYETERALAWVIDTGWPFGIASWYARCGDRSYGPTNLVIAKQAAEAFVLGAPLPEDDSGHSLSGPVNLHVVRALREPLP
jgi:hypothetical protein